MTPDTALELKLEDRLDGKAISPSHIPLPLLNKFNEQAAIFLRGSQKEIDLDHVAVSIDEGSYKLVIPTALLLAGLSSDLLMLEVGNLDDMDPKRAEVIETWQKAAHEGFHRSYGIRQSTNLMLSISKQSAYQRHRDGVWLAVEKYLHGQVVDLGGAKQPNLHLRRPDGTLQKIRVSQDKVLQEEKNLVYRYALLRVRAEQELTTGKLRNVHLLDFADYRPQFDAVEFDAITAKGRKAWADVPDATKWVEDLRGSA